MTVTRLSRDFAQLTSGFGSSTQIPSGGTGGQVPTANGSNGSYWGENIARITANGSNANTLIGPFVNIAAGANISLSTSSNTLTIAGAAGGVTGITSNGSNSLSGVPNLKAGTGIALGVSGQDITISNIGAGSGGGSGALVLLEQHTASASATLAFTTFITATYDEYMIEGVEVAPATDNVGFTMNVGTGAGPTYDTGTNYAYTMVGRTMGDAAHNAGGVGGTAAFLMYNVSNNAGYGFGNFSLKVTALQSTAHRKMFHGTCVYTNNVPTHVGDVVSLIWTTTATAATALRFQFTSGNIASGTIRIYGIVK